MANKLSLLFTVLIAFVISFAVAAILSHTYLNTGTVTELAEIKLDEEILADGDTILWGNCPVDTTKTIGILTVENIGDNTITVSLVTTEPMPKGLIVLWEPVTLTLASGEIATAPLTLTVPAEASLGDFQFDITLTVTETP